jgi:MoxR-like ATPase
MNEALKNRFVVIQVDYIDGDILKDVIKQINALILAASSEICPCLDIVRKSSLNLMICSIIAY